MKKSESIKKQKYSYLIIEIEIDKDISLQYESNVSIGHSETTNLQPNSS